MGGDGTDNNNWAAVAQVERASTRKFRIQLHAVRKSFSELTVALKVQSRSTDCTV